MKIVTEYTSATKKSVIKIESAAYVGNFVVHIDFSDRSSQDVDFGPFLIRALHPSIRKYLDEAKFQQFAIVDGNLNWNDYELIFPISALHSGVVDAKI